MPRQTLKRAPSQSTSDHLNARRAYQRGALSEPSSALIPVRISSSLEPSGLTERIPATSCGSIHIEFPGRALISVESGADPSLLRSILESLRK